MERTFNNMFNDTIIKIKEKQEQRLCLDCQGESKENFVTLFVEGKTSFGWTETEDINKWQT